MVSNARYATLFMLLSPETIYKTRSNVQNTRSSLAISNSLGDVNSDSLQVSRQTIANSSSLNSSAVENNSPSLPLVGLLDVWVSIVLGEQVDADRWQAVDVDGVVGVDDVGWLGADGRGGCLAGAELDGGSGGCDTLA